MFSKFFRNQSQSKTTHVILSSNISMSLDTRTTRLNNNTFIFGCDRKRVEESYILPNMRTNNCSYVVFDADGTLKNQTEQMFREKGYQIKVLNLADPKNSAHYNPFAYISQDEASCVAFADTLIEILLREKLQLVRNCNYLMQTMSESLPKGWGIQLEPVETAPYIRARRNLIASIILFLMKECRSDERKPANLVKLLEEARRSERRDDYSPEAEDAIVFDENYKTPLEIIFEDLGGTWPAHEACKYYSYFKHFQRGFFTNRKERGAQAKEAIADTLAKLRFLNEEPFATMTATDDLNIPSIGLQPTVLYVRPGTEAANRILLPLFFTQLFDALYHTAETECKGKPLPTHVRIILGGYEDCPPVPKLVFFLSTMRPYNISCNVNVYDYKRYQEMTGVYDRKFIRANCDEILYFPDEEKNIPEEVFKLIPKTSQELPKINPRTLKKRQIFINHKAVKPASRDHLCDLTPDDCLVMLNGCFAAIDKPYDGQ